MLDVAYNLLIQSLTLTGKIMKFNQKVFVHLPVFVCFLDKFHLGP